MVCDILLLYTMMVSVLAVDVDADDVETLLFTVHLLEFPHLQQQSQQARGRAYLILFFLTNARSSLVLGLATLFFLMLPSDFGF